MAVMNCARVIFKGRVQGVFFRANTKKFADELGVPGWVRNLPDGNVEALFVGNREKVEKVIEKCRSAQPYASVTGALVEWRECEDELSGFNIRY